LTELPARNTLRVKLLVIEGGGVNVNCIAEPSFMDVTIDTVPTVEAGVKSEATAVVNTVPDLTVMVQMIP